MSNLNLIIKIENDKGNKIFFKFFVLVNIVFLISSCLLYLQESVINSLNIQIHALFGLLFLAPIGLLMRKIDDSKFFKYLLISLYVFYIFSIGYIVDNKNFYLFSSLSLNIISLMYLSRKLYLITASITAVASTFVAYYYTDFIFVSLLSVLISIGGYLVLIKYLALLSNLLKNSNEPFIDQLTGTYNKYYLKEKISKMSPDSEKLLSIISLDIDNFKEINTKYGFNVGDELLKELANIIKQITRNSDSICRNEGDQFVLIIQHPKEFTADTLAERIRKTIQDKKFTIKDENSKNIEINITASFGVGSLKQGEDSDSLLNRAQLALERAKQNGKNRVEKD